MKTVQEYLKTVDESSLIGTYLYKNPVNLYDLPDSNKTISEAKKMIREKLQEYVHRLQTLQITPSHDNVENILFACKTSSNGQTKTECGLVKMDELLENGENAQIYSYTFSKQSEIMGYLVSETKYTQDHIYDILVSVMAEASIFGFNQERLSEEIEKMDRSVQEAKEGKCKSFSIDELREELGLPIPEQDENSDNLHRLIIQAEFEFDSYHTKKELRQLHQLLIQNIANKNNQ